MDLGQDAGADKKANAPAPKLSFFQKIFSFFSGSSDPETEKKRLLRLIARDHSRSRYKFFKIKGDEALPGLARFFYEIYKTIAPAQVLLSNSENSGSLRSFVIDSFLSDEQIQLSDRLTEQSISEMAKTMPVKMVQETVKNAMVQLFSFFDTDLMRKIDESYNILMSFIRFCNFDYFFLLKKFDSNLTERNFTYNPRFDSISADYIKDDIKDFLEVFNGLSMEADWKKIFTSLKEYRNLDVINADAWVKLVSAMREVRNSQVLVQTVQLADKDPYFTPTALVSNEKIVDPYLQKLKTQTDVIIQKVMQEKRNSKVEELAKLIFGTAAVSRMKNYAEKANVVFAKKMLGGFTYVQPLNFLKAFLLDFFKKDIREMIDILLIRGKWSTSMSSQSLSESFHSLMAASDALIEFDDSLADDGDMGSRLRMAMAKADRDKEQIKHLRNFLRDVNNKAVGIINQSASALISMGRTMKSLIEDFERSPHELVINWKEVDNASDGQIKDRMLDIYKKIYYFVQLMQYYVKEDSV
jgi:hypothetical protein